MHYPQVIDKREEKAKSNNGLNPKHMISLEYWIGKYNIPVPRYTSYPPANLFSSQYSSQELKEDILRSNEEGSKAISYYIHTPFCRKLCHFCACNKIPMLHNGTDEEVHTYFKYLQREIELVEELLHPDRPIAQIHFGGGSPTSVPLHYIIEIVDRLTHHRLLRTDAEIAIEAHPGYLSREMWDQLISAPFTRFSIGIQDLNKEVLQIANRTPSLVDIREVIAAIQDQGKRVNLDFIYGLPGQSVLSFTKSIEQAIEMAPDRLVTFSYAHVPWLYPQQKILEKRGLPSVEEKKEMYDETAKMMTAAGYVQVGLDHFVRPDDPLAVALQEHTLHRNFQGYCPRTLSGQVYALGVTGISQLHHSYAQSIKDNNGYYQALDERRLPTAIGYKLTKEECLARDIITDLMCNYRTNPLQHAENYGLHLSKLDELPILQKERLEEMLTDQLLSIDNNGLIVINPAAHLFVRNVASTFDIHYQPTNPRGYSKPI